MNPTANWRRQFEVPGRISFHDGSGELPKIEIDTGESLAEIYLHGAHLTHFQRKGDQPLLFLSRLSRFEHGAPIRGGVPLIFPWFGPREGFPAHGFARLSTWELKETTAPPGGPVTIKFELPDEAKGSSATPFTVEYRVVVGTELGLELTVTNNSDQTDYSFEACLHTYFLVGDIHSASVTGLQNCVYLDKCDHNARKQDTDGRIMFTQETDRTYVNTGDFVEIADPGFARRIRIETAGARSTVVWNPWIAKSQQMADFGDEEYLRMVCVESGNVADNRVTLPPGGSDSIRATISARPL